MLVDTHCHIHSIEFFSESEAEQALSDAIYAGVKKLICVATSLDDSKAAIAFAHRHPESCWATVGIHPHEAASMSEQQIKKQLSELSALATDNKVVGVGETGFDFYYNSKDETLQLQELLLRGQIEIAQAHNLPLSFHVREGFDEFWRVYESYKALRGVLHSFTDTSQNANKALHHGLYVGVNGIATFTTHNWQVDLFASLPLVNIVLETDSPFLTPKPKRGTMNTPENVTYITDFMAELRREKKDTVADATTANATKLFKLA